MVELLVVIAIIGVLIALLLPAVQAAREAARRMTCSNHMKQFCLAAHNFHDTHQTFPAAVQRIGGYWDGTGGWRFNVHAALLPFIEQQAMYDQFASGTLTPYYAPADTIINTFTCPSDGNVKEKGRTNSAGTAWSARINIQTCFGDSTRVQGNARGLFTWNGSATVTTTERDDGTLAARLIVPKSMANVTDGTSNSLFASECATALSAGLPALKGGIRNYTGLQVANGTVDPETSHAADCRAKVLDCLNTSISTTDRNALVSGSSSPWRGSRQFDRHQAYTNFNTLMRPNGPACAQGNNEASWGVYPPQSYHSGGVNCGFVDGSIRFITDNVDTNNLNGTIGGGDPNYGGQSRFGVWGALGSINGGESKGL
ncbi:MAG: DUF1559 domain-containing protein [Planctomycetaceae bacterium]|nr:DUF1559 domain-containing protein [Planctomycetaceae bacterium]